MPVSSCSNNSWGSFRQMATFCDCLVIQSPTYINSDRKRCSCQFLQFAYFVLVFLGIQLHLSVVGGQLQGNPLGPLLFSLTLSKALSLSRCNLTVAYLDEVTLRDSMNSLGGELEDFQRRANSIGLTLNVNKCKIIGLNRVSRNIW